MQLVVDCAACAAVVVVAIVIGLKLQLAVAVEPVVEVAAGAGESVAAEVVPVAFAFARELVGATGAGAWMVAVESEPQLIARAGIAALEAVVVGPELEAEVVAVVEVRVVAAVAK